MAVAVAIQRFNLEYRCIAAVGLQAARSRKRGKPQGLGGSRRNDLVAGNLFAVDIAHRFQLARAPRHVRESEVHGMAAVVVRGLEHLPGFPVLFNRWNHGLGNGFLAPELLPV